MTKARPALRLSAAVGAIGIALFSASSAMAQDAPDPAAPAAEADDRDGDIVVTGTRIRSAGLASTSPINTVDAEQIQLLRAVTIEDFSTKLPQLAGGVNSTSVGSDAFGAQTLDLRSLGQNRTLVLINGTRAVPFSFRNAVDVNAIPAPLLKRVDVLTGGAAAVYGADAVAGVVNFIINDDIRGLQASGNYRAVSDGASQASVYVSGGLDLGGRGSIVAYFEYTDRDPLLAGERLETRTGPATAPIGGNFRDVASGRTFSFDAAGNFTLTPQTTDYTSQFLLVQPLERINASAFFKYDLTDAIQAYGRFLYSGVDTRGGTRTGQNPATIGGAGVNVQIAQNNPFLTPQIRSQLTFVNGFATVNVQRSLGELGTTAAINDRDTWQGQIGLRGDLTPAIRWDAYYQIGETRENITVVGDGLRASFAGLVNTTDIFGPGGDFTSVLRDFDYGSRVRRQQVGSAYVSGDTGDFFNGWAGPFGFTAGYEYRHEKGRFSYSPDLSQSFNQGAESAPPVPPFIRVHELFGELVVPLLRDFPLVKSLTVEGAYRRSWYTRSVGEDRSYDTDKLGLNWVVSDDLRLRGTRQTVIRDANIGEFANPVFSIPFSSLVTVARLFPRYGGDPCALGTGNVEQCTRQGYRGPYDSRAAANLTGGYFFGGNANIRAETGRTYTVGGVLTPRFLPGLSLAVDYYSISIRDAVGQIQPVDALTSCYITDPSADNPLCQAVSRDPVTGFLRDAFVDDRNLARIKQQGVDVDFRYAFALPASLPGRQLAFGYQANFVTSYSIQRNAALTPVNCKGSYGARCSSDLVTLVSPDYRHRATVTWDAKPLTVQFGWKRIGEVRDSTVGSTDTIDAFDYFDLNVAIRPPTTGLTITIGVDNLFDKRPPTPRNAGAFNTYPDTYDILGRTVGGSLTLTL
ncbi:MULTISPECIES: TonB-dependent receptor plug domain-containing protein [unclassified Sphingomonas]|jgi:outer membrane receptor protein involved in Fe transport|uniref:TonB-dependent receptor plug domain-containing protein n=1 Tax=unclassified Sphingomonas TaxID=196159 RepID=UPI0008317D98|nr:MULTISPECIES: TonB-dependent receptor plug domain-containing protein [unclassified Sphingomonas]